MTHPSPASALTCAGDVGTGPAPISHLNIDDFITCINRETRTNAAGDAIELSTVNADHFIYLNNSGILTATNAANAAGIDTTTTGATSPITIINTNTITATSTGAKAFGIYAVTTGGGSEIRIENSGDFVATSTGPFAFGVYAQTLNGNSLLSIVNSGGFAVTAANYAFGIFAETYANSPLSIENHGDFTVTSNLKNAIGIDALTYDGHSALSVTNSGDFTVNGVTLAIGIFAKTHDGYSPISIVNSGDFAVTATSGVYDAFGVEAETFEGHSPLSIVNSGDFTVTNAARPASGIYARTLDGHSPLSITNSGDLAVTGGAYGSFGILGNTFDGYSPVSIVNSGHVRVTSTGGNAYGIYSRVSGGFSPVSIDNGGDFTVTAANLAAGIQVKTFTGYSPVSIVNRGDIDVTAGTDGFAINAAAFGQGSSIRIENSGDLRVRAADGGSTFIAGIYAQTPSNASNRPIDIVNRGSIDSDGAGIIAANLYDGADAGSFNPISIANYAAIRSVGDGISTETDAGFSGITIVNTGNVVTGEGTHYSVGFGIFAYTVGHNSPIAIVNAGAIDSGSAGLFAYSLGDGSPIDITNSGPIKSVGDGIFSHAEGTGSPISILNAGDINAKAGAGFTGDGIYAQTYLAKSAIEVVNEGKIKGADDGIDARTYGAGSPVSLTNKGSVSAADVGIKAISTGANSPVVIDNQGTIDPAVGIYAVAVGAGSTNLIKNSGTVYGDYAGILAVSFTGTTIVNTGKISAGSNFAIGVYGAPATIYNAGRITGFVDLTNSDDIFINQKGGVFETKLTSYFNGGNDLFRNETGGTVLAATDPSVKEFSAFTGLERFENKGLISLQDDAVGDVFRISNCYCSPIEFMGSGKSQLAIDAFLGGPGSTADNLIIDGNVAGKTKVDVNDTNAGPGVFNKQGIPVVYVNGPNVTGNEFFLSQPIDTGFFNYDLFFKPTGSGIFELKSFLGQGAFVLPQLITAAQDMWHSGSSTWFDRTADLRVLLNGGAAPAEDPNAKYAEGTPAPQNFTPAVWARGAGNWLNRDDSESVTAYGRDYRYNLNRDLETVDFQSGIDLGKRGLLADDDILVFGALGGYIHSDLDYDAINRIFSFDGGQVGGYATYLRGGLFVDTLVNVHLMQLDTRTLGFPNSLNATTVGVRTDSGYRFGSFHGGAFIEPLATISVDWADIDGFSQGGNKVSFNNDANVQGRLGLRVGTTTQLGYGITAEPFVIGSLWGNLSNDNQATLVSTGTTFILEDHLEDVWGEVSGGVNFFNPTASTSVFAKVDVTFGQDIDGVGGKAGMRVSW